MYWQNGPMRGYAARDTDVELPPAPGRHEAYRPNLWIKSRHLHPYLTIQAKPCTRPRKETDQKRPLCLSKREDIISLSNIFGQVEDTFSQYQTCKIIEHLSIVDCMRRKKNWNCLKNCESESTKSARFSNIGIVIILSVEKEGPR